MATTEFKKVIIVSHKEDQERLLAKIHRLGLVEIIKPADFDNPYLKEGTSQAPQDLESILKELRYSMDFLKGFEVKKTFFESLAQKKPVLDFNNIGQILKEFNSSSFCKKVDEIRHSQKELDIESERLIQRRKEISSWLKLEVPLQEIGYTKYTLSHLGAILAEKLAKFKEEAMSGISDLVIEEIDEAQGLSFIYVVYLKTEEQKASAVFKRHGFNYVYLSGLTDRPREILEDVTNKLAEVKKDRVDLLNRAKALLAIRDRIFILHDYFSNLKKRQDVLKNFLYTAETFILTGWIRRKDIDKFKNWIKGSFSNVEIMTKAPSKKDKIPIELENKGFFKPFEFITNIYGLPAHGEVDPTPFLAPFFFLFFGLCLSDAGYGAVVSLVSWFVLKRFKMGPQGVRFFKLFFYCGISATVIGALTGSWFGNFIDIIAGSGLKPFLFLKAIKNSITILDPQKEPMRLLIIALFLGVIQIWVGHFVAMYGNLKNKRFLDAILDQGSILLFLLGFTGFLLCFFGVSGKAASPIFLKILIAGSLAIVLTQGRSNPGIGAKLFFGLYSLYSSFSGYISDVLSYSRLWALGLVTGVMAYTCNLMAVMIGGLIPYAGIIVTVLLLIVGHLFTLAMNLLGAFVHPVRLQFVEFFSKFFRGGGKPFRPLRIESKYTVLGEGAR